MGKYLRVFSRIPAFRFRNDRLHCHDDRLRCRELPGSPYMKTVVMAMKTVVRRKNRAPHGKEPSQDLIWNPQKLFEDPFAEGIKAVFKVFFIIRGGYLRQLLVIRLICSGYSCFSNRAIRFSVDGCVLIMYSVKVGRSP